MSRKNDRRTSKDTAARGALGSPRLYPVIIAGGSGTRFWPLSRQSRPKQFLALATQAPLISDTAERLSGLAGIDDTFVVCGKAHAAAASRLVKGLPKANLLVEPAARNTAPAIGLAAAQVFARDPHGLLAVLPSDQHVADVLGFEAALAKAAEVAATGQIVTLGIAPTRPETGYGYIKVGKSLGSGASTVDAFVEKPDEKTARRYLKAGNYLWNAGIFVFQASVMLEAIAEHMPELSKGLDLIRAAIGTAKYSSVLNKVFPTLPSVSIDYGVAERASNIAVVPGDFGWSDVGAFNALPEVRQADERGNVVCGEGALVIDCDDCVIWADRRPLAVVGLSKVVVVDSGDAVLVLPAEKSQDVRKVVEALKARKLDRYL